MESNAKQQLLSDVKTTARKKYDASDEEVTKIKEELFSAVKREDWEDAEEEFDRLEEEKGWGFEEERQFMQDIVNPGKVETVGEEKVTDDMPRREKLILERQIEQTESDELLAKTDKKVATSHLFDLSEQLYINKGCMAFIISEQKTWDGRVSVELSDTKKKFELLSVYQNKDNEFFFKHFGQSNPNKGYNKIDDLTKSFYQYKFIADDKEYLALSTEKLDTVRCKLTGTKISLSDYKTVGENRKLPVDQDIIFVNSVDPAIDTMSDEELDEYRNGVDHDFLAEKLLGDWRQPEWYEIFLFADMAVNDENGYPSHIINLSKPGTGKSKIIEAALRSMDEAQKEPFTGSGSTVKGLVPSFKSDPPEEGYLLKTQRLAGVDEKMDLLSNTIKKNNNASNDVFRPLLNLLTHDTRSFDSGNGSIKGEMMSTMWASGNFDAYGIRDMKQLTEKIDHAYLSRCIIYSYIQSHVDFINDREPKLKQKMQEQNLNEEDLYPERDDRFISMMDTLREEKFAQIDYRKVKEVHGELMKAVPGYMREIFNQRGPQHMENITLGIVKYHYLVDNREDLEARDGDYEMMNKIFELIISGWDDVDKEELSFNAMKEALTHAQRKVFNVIEEKPGCTPSEIGAEVDVDSLAWCLTALRRDDLVAVDDAGEEDLYYPHFTDEYKELKDGLVYS